MPPIPPRPASASALYLMAVLLLATAPACSPEPSKGTIVGNPPQGVTLDMRAASDELSTGKVAREFTLTSAWMSVERVRLRPAGDCSGEAESRLDGPLVADLLDAGILPEPPEIELNTNRFCRLEMAFSRIDLDDAPIGTPAALADHSLLVEGVLGDGTPFQIASRMGDSVRIEATDGEDLVVSEDAACLKITPDVFGWIDEAALEALGGGAKIYVNEDINEAVLDDFEDTVEDGLELIESRSGSCSGGVTIGTN